MTTDTEYTWIKQHNYIIDAVRDGAGSTLIAACLHDLEETIRNEERARYAPLVEAARQTVNHVVSRDLLRLALEALDQPL